MEEEGKLRQEGVGFGGSKVEKKKPQESDRQVLEGKQNYPILMFVQLIHLTPKQNQDKSLCWKTIALSSVLQKKYLPC